MANQESDRHRLAVSRGSRTLQTGKLDSNAAVENGLYPFFTCDPKTLSIDTWAYDTEAVLLAGKQETKASVDNLIRDVLYDGLPDSYPVEQINEYRRRIFEYVYTQYGTAA